MNREVIVSLLGSRLHNLCQGPVGIQPRESAFYHPTPGEQDIVSRSFFSTEDKAVPELMSGRIRANAETLRKQHELMNQLDFLKFPYHKATLQNEILLSIESGIGPHRKNVNVRDTVASYFCPWFGIVSYQETLGR